MDQFSFILMHLLDSKLETNKENVLQNTMKNVGNGSNDSVRENDILALEILSENHIHGVKL